MADTQDLEQNASVRKLRAWDPQAVASVGAFRGEWTVEVPIGHVHRACDFLKSDPELRFTFLSDITCADRYPNEPRFELNYHLVSMSLRERLRLKVRVNGSDPVVETVSAVWPTADWHEREIFDLFGVRFEGHPDLRRILMPEDWEGHPLRKDYPTEGFR